MSSVVEQMLDTKCGCGGRGNVGHWECSDYAASGSAGNEVSGGPEECLGREVSGSGTEHLSEAVCIDVEGKEDAGHECTFCCTCWTDE
ncbi:hypothetical protein [Paenibacillus taichungensis]|uniref:hypothetical protein n=1 Tax=Paenibacillus taichungensis TaxID=484184 RepID=UPI0011BDC23B|nr:hypothetical protein [Paenibacillus taichungensis]